MWTALWIALGLLGTACSADATTPDLVGDWVSPACGERTYPRHLTIAPDKTWTCTDLVSPCPPDARCIWSGIVTTRGTWTTTPEGIALTETPPASGKATPRPTQLSAVDAGASSSEAGQTCAYTRSAGPPQGGSPVPKKGP